jgi:hypothetical protein
MIKRNVIEFALIIAVWWLFQMYFDKGIAKQWAVPLILVVSLLKTAFFGVENIRQLMEASHQNLAYHRFMLLMLVNMAQIILSFGLDFHCLHIVSATYFSTNLANATFAETVFEFIYFSTLNFTFFGYGDVTPQSVPAKLITMSEILLAFVTVIFLLSDFISLKESLGKPGNKT